MTRKPRIAITVGDPAGIGPEIARKAADDARVRDACEPVLYGPPTGASFKPGVLSAEAGRAAYEVICNAVRDALAGSVAGMATAPVNKAAFARAGLPWKGHTDLLGNLTGAGQVAMMFWSEPLKVVLASVHVPLRDVSSVITRTLIDNVIELAHRELPRFGIPSPRLAMAGLNPHAGEDGLMGDEEQRVLRPAVEAAQARGIAIDGPFPADTVFVHAVTWRVRCRDCQLPRPGLDTGETACIRACCQRHAGTADHPDLCGSWDGVRHCGQGNRRSREHD